MSCQCKPKPPRWGDLTPDEQLEFGNGCGPDFFPDWLIALLFGWFFDASCRRHDFGYDRGGSERDREKVDHGFYKAMLRDADRLDDLGFLFQYLAALIMAMVFYRLVRWFGWLRFSYGPYRTLNELVSTDPIWERQ